MWTMLLMATLLPTWFYSTVVLVKQQQYVGKLEPYGQTGANNTGRQSSI